MKTYTRILQLLIALLLVAAPASYAQEPDTSEVDRILGDLDVESDTQTEVTTDSEPGDTLVSEVETEPMEELPGVEEEAADTADVMEESPDAIPAVSLEEAETVEGLDIEGAENINEGLVTISYTDVSLADMVRIFAQTAGANIIIPEGLDMPVSGNLNDVFWRDALAVILREKGYALVERQSGIFTITPEADLEAEPLRSETLEFQYITAESARPAVESLLVSSNATAIALRDSNNLIIKESAQQIEEIKRIVKTIDRPRKQVFIEAKFVELNDSAIQDLGINWEVLQGYTVSASGLTADYTRTDTTSTLDSEGATNARVRTDSRTNTFTTPGTTTIDGYDAWYNNFRPDDRSLDTVGAGTSSGARGNAQATAQGRNIGGIEFDPTEGTVELDAIPNMEQIVTKQAVLSADEFALTLSALQQLDGTRIVSNPKMLVANGQTATIHVGRNEPNIVAVPQGENATTFAYVLDGFIEIGVKLEVTPTISTDKNITINIIPELSRLLGEKTVGEAGTSFPITQIRRISTEFAVASGMTVAIGGLTQSEEQEEVNKVPVLGDLPIIGKYLFTHTSTREVQDEIIIFVSVNTVNDTANMNNTDGIPDEGKLIHTWLSMKEEQAAEEAKAEEDM